MDEIVGEKEVNEMYLQKPSACIFGDHGFTSVKETNTRISNGYLGQVDQWGTREDLPDLQFRGDHVLLKFCDRIEGEEGNRIAQSFPQIYTTCPASRAGIQST